jgi:hypothetical protein
LLITRAQFLIAHCLPIDPHCTVSTLERLNFKCLIQPHSTDNFGFVLQTKAPLFILLFSFPQIIKSIHFLPYPWPKPSLLCNQYVWKCQCIPAWAAGRGWGPWTAGWSWQEDGWKGCPVNPIRAISSCIKSLSFHTWAQGVGCGPLDVVDRNSYLTLSHFLPYLKTNYYAFGLKKKLSKKPQGRLLILTPSQIIVPKSHLIHAPPVCMDH